MAARTLGTFSEGRMFMDAPKAAALLKLANYAPRRPDCWRRYSKQRPPALAAGSA